MNNFDVAGDLVYVTLDLHPLLASKTQKKMLPYSKLPSKVLDISLVVKESTKWSEIESLVWKNGSDLLKSVEVFEAEYLYVKGSLPRFHKELGLKGHKNLAFHLVFQAKDRTLKDSEIMPIYDKIKVELKTKLGAEIR
jgi:phenylalanyl-tRNA synthetase beta chain